MSELRKDPVTGRWVIISTERRKRPSDFRVEPHQVVRDDYCPFCNGHEDLTPPEVFAIRSNGGPANGPGWDLRVVPNKFPALQVEGGLDREGEGMFDRMNGIGAHEVIIETPSHDQTLASMSEGQIERVLEAFRARVLDLKRDRRFRYILIFKNHGAPAGATLEHSHSQLIALPIVPDFGPRRDRRGAASLRRQGALRLLRHPPSGAGGRAADHSRERGHRGARALCAAVSVRDVAGAEAAWGEVRGRRRTRVRSAGAPAEGAAAADEPGARVAVVQPDHPHARRFPKKRAISITGTSS